MEDIQTIKNNIILSLKNKRNIQTIAIKEQYNKILASGLLLPKDKVSRNGVLYDWESAKNTVTKIKGLPMMYNHQVEGNQKPVGHFTDAIALEKRPTEGKWQEVWDKAAEELNTPEGIPGVYYEADINPNSEYADSVIRGDVRKVSIQVIPEEQTKETTDDGDSYTRAYIKDYVESSVVPSPGFMETTLSVMCENFNIKKIKEGKSMKEAIKIGDKVHCPSGYSKVIGVNGNKITVRSQDPAGDFEYDISQVQKENYKEELKVDMKHIQKLKDNNIDFTKIGNELLIDESNNKVLDGLGIPYKENLKEGVERDVYYFVRGKMKGYGSFRNSDEMEKTVKQKFGWNDDIEESAWEAWNDSEKESLKEDDVEKGLFPSDEFNKGLKIEQAEHPNLNVLEAGQLVLDHLKEDEYYYSNKESQSTANNQGAMTVKRPEEKCGNKKEMSPEAKKVLDLYNKGIPAGKIAKDLNLDFNYVTDLITHNKEFYPDEELGKDYIEKDGIYKTIDELKEEEAEELVESFKESIINKSNYLRVVANAVKTATNEKDRTALDYLRKTFAKLEDDMNSKKLDIDNLERHVGEILADVGLKFNNDLSVVYTESILPLDKLHENVCKESPKAKIWTVDGQKTFVKEVDDKEFERGDYSTNKGYWVTHNDGKHQIYESLKDIKKSVRKTKKDIQGITHHFLADVADKYTSAVKIGDEIIWGNQSDEEKLKKLAELEKGLFITFGALPIAMAILTPINSLELAIRLPALYGIVSLLGTLGVHKIKQEIEDIIKSKVLNEAYGKLSSDQSDILEGIVLSNKNKDKNAILIIAKKEEDFKNINDKDLLEYIEDIKEIYQL